MTDTPPDDCIDFASGLGWWVSTYSILRAAEGNPLSYQEAVSGVLVILLNVIKQGETLDVQRSAAKAGHLALDEAFGDAPARKKESLN